MNLIRYIRDKMKGTKQLTVKEIVKKERKKFIEILTKEIEALDIVKCHKKDELPEEWKEGWNALARVQKKDLIRIIITLKKTS